MTPTPFNCTLYKKEPTILLSYNDLDLAIQVLINLSETPTNNLEAAKHLAGLLPEISEVGEHVLHAKRKEVLEKHCWMDQYDRPRLTKEGQYRFKSDINKQVAQEALEEAFKTQRVEVELTVPAWVVEGIKIAAVQYDNLAPLINDEVTVRHVPCS